MNIIVTDYTPDGKQKTIGVAHSGNGALTLIEAATASGPRAECCGGLYSENERTGWKPLLSHIDDEHLGDGDSLVEWAPGYGPFREVTVSEGAPVEEASRTESRPAAEVFDEIEAEVAAEAESDGSEA